MVVKSFSLFGRELFRVVRDRSGQVSYQFMDGSDFAYSENYLKLSLENPVLMTICALRAKMYSQMKISHVNANGDVIENSPYVKRLMTPNFFQSKEDFFFQQMWFLSATGTCLSYEIKASRINPLPEAIYNLIPSEIKLNDTHKISKFITTKADQRAYQDKTIKYTLDNETYNIRIGDLIPFYDLANGLIPNSFMRSPSRVKGVYKVLQNIEENLKSKYNNLKFSQKYMVTNKENSGMASNILDEDRKDIERKIGNQDTIITNAVVDAKHLISDLKKLYLDEQFASDALKVLLAFDMNKDILNYFGVGGSTYENQEKGELRYLQNSIMPTAESTMNSYSQQWGLFEKDEKLVASYDHLNIMQPVMNDKLDTFFKLQQGIEKGLANQSISEAEAKEMTERLIKRLGL